MSLVKKILTLILLSFLESGVYYLAKDIDSVCSIDTFLDGFWIDCVIINLTYLLVHEF